jgi:hypothetical protein
VGGRGAARRRAGGGEGIQAPRAARARLAAGGGGVALAAGTGIWLAVLAEEAYLVRWTLFATLVATGCLVLAVAVRRPFPIPLAVVALALPYVAILTLEIESLDSRAPLLAALLFGANELAYWSLELRGSLTDEPGTYLRRVALVAGLMVGVYAGGTAVLALAEGFSAEGPTVDAVGAAAALIVVALLALAAASRRQG